MEIVKRRNVGPVCWRRGSRWRRRATGRRTGPGPAPTPPTRTPRSERRQRAAHPRSPSPFQYSPREFAAAVGSLPPKAAEGCAERIWGGGENSTDIAPFFLLNSCQTWCARGAWSKKWYIHYATLAAEEDGVLGEFGMVMFKIQS